MASRAMAAAVSSMHSLLLSDQPKNVKRAHKKLNKLLCIALYREGTAFFLMDCWTQYIWWVKGDTVCLDQKMVQIYKFMLFRPPIPPPML